MVSILMILTPPPPPFLSVQVDAPFLPVRFTFPDASQTIYFNISGFDFAPVDPAVLAVPADCTTSCKSRR